MTRPWTHIMLHHSLTEDSDTVSWGAIRRYHMEEKGWSDIGYHFGVELVNGHYEIMVGRSLDRAGAHCKEGNMNQLAIGICAVGNFDLASPPEAQIAALHDLVQGLMFQYGIPAANVVGHREFAPYKSCPGTQCDLDAFRDGLVDGTAP